MSFKPPHIVLSICPPWGVAHPPLGLGYLAANLAGTGFRARILDLNLAVFKGAAPELKELWRLGSEWIWRRPDEVRALLSHFQPTVDQFIDQVSLSGSPVLGFSVIDPNELTTSLILRRLKKARPDLTILAGGPACFSPGQRSFLREHSGGAIDHFLIGEAEESLPAFLAALESGFSPDRPPVPSLVPGRQEPPETGPAGRTGVDLKRLRYPTFADLDLGRYQSDSLAVMWSRGCIGRCVFCKERSLWGGYRHRSVENILEELRYHRENNGIRRFVVYDSVINGRPAHLKRVCEAIIEDRLDIEFSGEAIARRDLSPEILGKMRRAGCRTLVFGLESGSDRILKAMGKLFTREEAQETLRDAHRAGIQVAVNIIVGFPGEGEREFRETLDFLRNNREHIDRLDSASTLQVVHGTPLAEAWRDYDLILPPDQPHDYWSTPDGNTHSVRQERLKRLLELADDLDLTIGRSFLDPVDPAPIPPLWEPVRSPGRAEDLEEERKEDRPAADPEKTGKAPPPPEPASRPPSGRTAILVVPWQPLDAPPLAEAWLRAWLQDRGREAELIDANRWALEKAPPLLKRAWPRLDNRLWTGNADLKFEAETRRELIGWCLGRLEAGRFDQVILSASRGAWEMAGRIAEAVKRRRPETRVLFYPHCLTRSIIQHVNGLCPAADGVIYGEAETVLASTAAASEGKRSRRALLPPGPTGRLVAQVAPPNDLDLLPLPEPSEVLAPDGRTAHILNARGCQGRCTFCDVYNAWGPARYRSGESLFREITALVSALGVGSFRLASCVGPGGFRDLADMARLIVDQGLEISWSAEMIPDMALDQESLTLLARSGCRSLDFHVGAVSAAGGRMLNHRIDRNLLARILVRCRDQGIAGRMDLLLGLPGETEADRLETWRFISRRVQGRAGLWRLAPCPTPLGSPFSIHAGRYNLNLGPVFDPGDWHDGGSNNRSFRRTRLAEASALLDRLGVEYRLEPGPVPDLGRAERDDVVGYLTSEMERLPETVLIDRREDRGRPPGPDPARLAALLDAAGRPAAVLALFPEPGVPERDRLRSQVEKLTAVRAGAYVFGLDRDDPSPLALLTAKLRRADPSARIIVYGSPRPVEDAEERLKTGFEAVDYWLLGDPAASLPQLLAALAEEEPADPPPGVADREGFLSGQTPPPVWLTPGSEPVWPDLERFGPLEGFGELDVRFGRDGPDGGADPERLYPPDELASWLRGLAGRTGIEHFNAVDPAPAPDSDWLERLAGALAGPGPRVRWRCSLETGAEPEPGLLKNLARAGCWAVRPSGAEGRGGAGDWAREANRAGLAFDPTEERIARTIRPGGQDCHMFRLADDLDLRGIQTGWQALRGPNILEIDLSNRCNLNCLGCWCHSPLLPESPFAPGEEKMELPGDELCRLVVEAADMGVGVVQISGAGEPFLHPEILRVLDCIKRHGLVLRLVTNGTRLNERICRELVELEVDLITVSVWAGDEETYSELHPGCRSGTFDSLRRNLSALARLKREQGRVLPEVKIYNVLMKQNFDRIRSMVKFASSVGADAVEFTPIDVVKGATEGLTLGPEQRRAIVRQLNRLHPKLVLSEWTRPALSLRPRPDHEAGEFSGFGYLAGSDLPDGFAPARDGRLTCPAGVRVGPLERRGSFGGRLSYGFPPETCRICFKRSACPVDTDSGRFEILLPALLGVGTLYRRMSEKSDQQEYDRSLIMDLPCYAGWVYSRVRANGDVIPCCKGVKKPMGNLHRRGFGEIWRGQDMDEFRNKAKYLPKTNPYFRPFQCLSQCDNVGMNLVVDQRLRSPSPSQAKAMKRAAADPEED